MDNLKRALIVAGSTLIVTVAALGFFYMVGRKDKIRKERAREYSFTRRVW